MEQGLQSNSSKALALIMQAAREYTGAEFKFYNKGFVKYSQEGKSIFIEDIYIEPHFRGTPVSSMILEKFNNFLKSTGAIFIYGYVMKDNKQCKKRLTTFKKWGLDVTTEEDKYYIVGCLINQLKGK